MKNPVTLESTRLKGFLVSLVISAWILLTSYALNILQDPRGIPITGSLIILTLLTPLLYPKEDPRYCVLVFTPLFLSYVVIVNIAFSFSPVGLHTIGSLYVILTSLLMITVVAWNLAAKLNLWELSSHLPIFFFLTLTIMHELKEMGASVYIFIWILALATLSSRSFKAYLSDVMSITFSLLPFIGVYYLAPDVTLVPHLFVASAEELIDLLPIIIVSFTIASFISVLTRTTPSGEITNVLVVVASQLLPLLGFVSSFYLSMSVVRSGPFYSYLEFNIVSAILIGIITSSLIMTSYYVKVIAKERKHLMPVLDSLIHEVEVLKQVYETMRSSGLWGEDELETARTTIARLEDMARSSKVELSKRLISTTRFQMLRDAIEFMRSDIDKVSANMLELFSNSINVLAKSIALITATPYGDEHLREKLPNIPTYSVTDIPSYIGVVSGLLRDSCLRLKSLILNTYMTATEQFGSIPLDISKMKDVDCSSSSSMVKEMTLMLNVHSNLTDLTLPRLRAIHSKLINLRSLLNSMLNKLNKKPLRDLDSALFIEKMHHVLADIPEIVSETDVISYSKTYAATYINLLNMLNELCEALSTDINKVGMKIKTVYGENIDVEELLLSRLRRHVTLIRSKVSKESITTPTNLVSGFNELLTEMPSILENIILVIDRLAILNNLTEYLQLFSDYIMYELSRKGSVNISELPFTAEVSIQLLWILLMSRTDLEIREGTVYMKRGS